METPQYEDYAVDFSQTVSFRGPRISKDVVGGVDAGDQRPPKYPKCSTLHHLSIYLLDIFLQFLASIHNFEGLSAPPWLCAGNGEMIRNEVSLRSLRGRKL